ncbi:MAG TPA: prepilin-type N-terminal cleavage/methylation domain-containing protein [candidate division CPR3 bacterium]|uniref:Prepilin-type N-terminal cleavage/methylation domain-containing protein n=1 Tax=candidate division CPR3 bacterium TaxID=2268181 RepID=A0A7C1NME7_UNCC3|nr:prepilin-type N-terminal cleavage/methylation domain-containing protein [candidate division CPR3 bacterium]
MKKGFTIIEVLVALVLLTVGAGGAFALLSRTISFTSTANGRLVATYLAQEGIEIVRNIRDTNWLQGEALNEGIADGDWRVDYTEAELDNPYDGEFLKLSGGMYQYVLGDDTSLQRNITIGNIADGITVDVEVSWTTKGQAHSVESSTILYNWLPQREPE